MNFKELLKITKLKVVLVILGLIAELYAISQCYRLGVPACSDFFYYISIPFVVVLEPVGDFNIGLMMFLYLVLFAAAFYILGMLFELIYRTFKKN